MTFFIELEQTILKFMWNYKRDRIGNAEEKNKAMLKKKNKARGITHLRHQKHCKTSRNQNNMVLA